MGFAERSVMQDKHFWVTVWHNGTVRDEGILFFTREHCNDEENGDVLVYKNVLTCWWFGKGVYNAPTMSEPGNARPLTTKQHLAVIRDAIELHKSRTNAYPAAETIIVDLSEYMRGNFPEPRVGAGKGNATVKASTQDPIGDPSGTEGWIYNETTGEFRVNDAEYLAW